MEVVLLVRKKERRRLHDRSERVSFVWNEGLQMGVLHCRYLLVESVGV